MKYLEIKDLLRQCNVFATLCEEDLDLMAKCGVNAVFREGQLLAQEGHPADLFYLIRNGKVAIETHVPHRGTVTLQSLGTGEVVGWSWLFPPYLWMFDVRALEDTRVISLDGKCLREKCEANHSLGFRLMKTFMGTLVARVHDARLQVLDVYHSPKGG